MRDSGVATMETLSTPPNPFIADGALAIPSFEDWFYLPGDWALYLLGSYAPRTAEMLGIDPGDYRGFVAGMAAWFFWIAFAVALIITTSAVRRVDDAVTRGFVVGFAELRRRVRMAVVLARYRRGRRVVRKEPTFEGEEPRLSRDEVRALELHANVAPGFALSVSDVAEELDVRAYEVSAALERLGRLKLLQSTVGGLDGEVAYTLTAGGRALLRMRHARPSPA
jgi:hypothetical protein